MAGGTKRLPRAVREQQMLDAAVQMFSVNGYHETSMDVIAGEAQISKPMLYLYYGSKEELFGACLARELSRFIEAVREDIDLKQSPHDLLRSVILSVLQYIDASTSKTLPEITAGLEKTLTNANKVLLSFNSGYGDNTQFSRDLGRLLVQLNDAVRSIRAFADLLARHPEALIKGRAAGGVE